MKRYHPNLHRSITLPALLTLVGAAGCQSQPTASYTNPFTAPDRVPPPATRTLLPGQAAPYYPGDPLPAMQSSAANNPAATLTASAATTQRATTSPPAASRPSPTPSNEAIVAIPSDGNPLRFALPKPPASPTPPPPQPAGQIVQAQATPSVSPALYNQPLPANPSTMNGQPAGGNGMAPNMAASSGPWRSPQIARQNITTPQPTGFSPQPAGPPLVAVAPANYAGPPPMTTMAPQTMAVRLRAVPSPPPEPVEASAPRIRLPGYTVPQAGSAPPPAVEQAAYYYSPGSAPVAAPRPNGNLQTVQISPVAANTVAPSVATLASGDGFRARGSMR